MLTFWEPFGPTFWAQSVGLARWSGPAARPCRQYLSPDLVASSSRQTLSPDLVARTCRQNSPPNLAARTGRQPGQRPHGALGEDQAILKKKRSISKNRHFLLPDFLPRQTARLNGGFCFYTLRNRSKSPPATPKHSDENRDRATFITVSRGAGGVSVGQGPLKNPRAP